jgi:hypothetical protein
VDQGTGGQLSNPKPKTETENAAPKPIKVNWLNSLVDERGELTPTAKEACDFGKEWLQDYAQGQLKKWTINLSLKGIGLALEAGGLHGAKDATDEIADKIQETTEEDKVQGFIEKFQHLLKLWNSPTVANGFPVVKDVWDFFED